MESFPLYIGNTWKIFHVFTLLDRILDNKNQSE